MPIARKNYRPPAGSVVDQNEPRASWNGKEWRLNNRRYSPPSSHRLIGKPGGSLSGWYYDWKQRAWMEPDRSTPAVGARPPVTSRPPAARPPIMRPPATQPFVPTTQQPTVVSAEKDPMRRDNNVLQFLLQHPVAPLIGGFLIVGSMMADEPQPPQIPEGLPEATAKQWQMIYAQNLQRFERRQQMWETAGKVLLGYAEANAVLAGVTAATQPAAAAGVPLSLPRAL